MSGNTSEKERYPSQYRKLLTMSEEAFAEIDFSGEEARDE